MNSNHFLISLKIILIYIIVTVTSDPYYHKPGDAPHHNDHYADGSVHWPIGVSEEQKDVGSCSSKKLDEQKPVTPIYPPRVYQKPNAYNPSIFGPETGIVNNHIARPKSDNQYKHLVVSDEDSDEPEIRDQNSVKPAKKRCKHLEEDIFGNTRRQMVGEDPMQRSYGSVTCYACSNVSSPYCLQPNDRTLVKNCIGTASCVKKLIKAEGLSVLVRDCGDKCESAYSDKSSSCHVCRGDLCNSAFSITSDSFLFNSISSMAIFIIFKFM